MIFLLCVHRVNFIFANVLWDEKTHRSLNIMSLVFSSFQSTCKWISYHCLRFSIGVRNGWFDSLIWWAQIQYFYWYRKQFTLSTAAKYNASVCCWYRNRNMHLIPHFTDRIISVLVLLVIYIYPITSMINASIATDWVHTQTVPFFSIFSFLLDTYSVARILSSKIWILGIPQLITGMPLLIGLVDIKYI